MTFGQSLSSIKRNSASIWAKYVGRMHWRNNIVANDGSLYLSSSGRMWDVPDDLDGVRRVSLESGATLWFCPTGSDANEIALFGGLIIVGADNGSILAVNAQSGDIVSSFLAGSPVFTKAIEIQMEDRILYITLSHQGDIIAYDPSKSAFELLDTLPYTFRANPVAVPSANERGRFLAAADSGEILSVVLSPTGVQFSQAYAVQPSQSALADFQIGLVGISSLIVIGDRVVVSYARDTYDTFPPIDCFSLASGKKIWRAKPVRTVSKKRQAFGNSRITPVVWKDQLLSTFSYDAGLHSFSLETGRWLWKVQLDQGYFQNWSSPVIFEDDLYAARIDGVLSKVDLNRKKIVKSVSIEIIRSNADDTFGDQSDDAPGAWPEKNFEHDLPGPSPSQRLTAGICATPAIADGKIVVGTVSGSLVCLQL